MIIPIVVPAFTSPLMMLSIRWRKIDAISLKIEFKERFPCEGIDCEGI